MKMMVTMMIGNYTEEDGADDDDRVDDDADE